MFKQFSRHHFLFSELVKRDFKKKYKRTYLGVLWSLLGPLLQLTAMALIFTQLFGRDTPNFIVYLFAGNLVFTYFSQSTKAGMKSLKSNANIINNVHSPKWVFLLSTNVAALINFLLTLVLFFGFVLFDGLLSFYFPLILYSVVMLMFFNIGVGLILSSLHVFFRDIEYLYDVITMLVMWFSAIFYTTDGFSPWMQRMFLLNPIYTYITYIRIAVIGGRVPPDYLHILTAGYAMMVLLLGAWLYRKNNYKFFYYM